MKYLAIIALAFVGCETTTDTDGVRTSRFDGAAFGSVIKASGDLYDRVQASQRMQQPYYQQQQPAYYPQP